MLPTFSRYSAIVTLLAAGIPGLAQTAAEWDSTRVNEIAGKLRCPCGCQLSMSCQMPPHPCPTCRKNRIRIYNMLTAGMSEQQIVAQYVAEEGNGALWVTPGAAGKAAPYAVLLAGAGIVVLVIRRMKKKPEADSQLDGPTLERLNKELAECEE